MNIMRRNWTRYIYAGAVRAFAGCLLIGLVLSACLSQTPQPPAPPEQPLPPSTEAVQVPSDIPVEPTPMPDLADKLVDQLWLLVAYGDAANPTVVEEGTTVTAVFSMDGTLSGSGGCNNYSTTYQLTGDQLTVGQIASTMMACEKGMEQEFAVLAALQSAQTINFSSEGRLEISYNSTSGMETKLIFAPGETPLVGTVWVLLSYGDPNSPTPVETGTSITAIFSEEGSLSGSGGCNSYSAGYTVKDDTIQIQQPINTLMACTQGMEQEQAYLTAIAKAETFMIFGPRLEINYDSGKGKLVYTGRSLTLEHTLWSLVTMDGQPANAGLPVTALFVPGEDPSKGSVGGVAPCNNYQAGYSVDGDQLDMEPAATTRISCPEAVMEAETRFLQLMETAQSYQVLGQTLTISSEDGALIFAANRAALEGTNWRLTAMGPAEAPQAPVSGADFTAIFIRQPNVPSGNIAGGSGCNDYNATYTASLNEIKINPPTKTNNPGCAQGLPEQEAQYFSALNEARSYRILGDRLQIPYGDNQLLEYTAFIPAPPPEGGPLTVLNGSEWWLVSMGSRTPLPGTQITAKFQINSDGVTGQVGGSSGCNSYKASVTGVFTVGPAATTRMYCAEPQGVMEQETAYLAMLASSQNFSVANNQLLIGTASGVLVFYNARNAMVPVEPSQPTATPPTAGPSQPTVTPPTVEPDQPTAIPTTEEPTLPTNTPPTPEPSAPPEAVINGPSAAAVGQEVAFDASGSKSDAGIALYKWDFGDGNNAEGVKVAHIFNTPGTYKVTLTVVDGFGQTGTETIQIMIT